jgi:hypothetical protein
MPAPIERKFGTILLGIWLVSSVLLLVLGREAILNWRFGDPDDQMRVVQIRDWLAGQSWWDITQYRMNPPDGGPMHWSRLVDIPIAAVILLFSLFVQRESAELAAFAVVPLLTFGAALWLYARLGRRLFGAGPALLASALTVTLLPVMTQLVPMRIDHHGWQIVLFLAAATALFAPERPRLAGAVLGIACAVWLEISVEGLPFAVMLLGLLALRWIVPALGTNSDPQGSFLSAMGAISISSALLFILTENGFTHGNHCDSLSPVHVLAIPAISALLFAACGLAHVMRRPMNWKMKIGTGMIAAVGGIAVLLSVAPQCTGDAFASLDPLVRDYWFSRTQEGLPLWSIDPKIALPSWAAFAVGTVALAVLFAMRIPAALGDRIVMICLFAGCVLVGLLVSRTTLYAVLLANLFAATLCLDWLRRAEKYTTVTMRMLLRIAAVIIILPTAFANMAMGLVPDKDAEPLAKRSVSEPDFEDKVRHCQSSKAFRALRELPKSSQLLAGLDTSPGILLFTDHKVIASGHHRNQKAMADVIRAFTGSEEEALRIYKARGIDYLVTCEGSYELQFYHARAPHGFGAQVQRGKLPVWLSKDRVIGPFSVYKVDWTQEAKP